MRKEKISGRNLKREIRLALCSDDIITAMDFITKMPPKRAVNPLFSFLCSLDERLKWRAVTAMGQVVSNLAETDLESARVIMRRFMWHLNDESGGIGWGCPESMGEIMARCERLADEYGCLLISYIQPEGNYLEHEILQRGVLWGVGRLVHSRPQFLKDAAAKGCRTITGLDMFVFQGAHQFELWTGKSAPEEVMRAVVLQALQTNF